MLTGSREEKKGLVTGCGGLCRVRYMVLWHAVIKSSLRLTAWHLFTKDFNFPDSPFPPPITPSSPRTLCLEPCLYFSPSVTFVSPCSLSRLSVYLTLSLSRNPVCAGNKLMMAATAEKAPCFLLHKSICFIIIHFCLFTQA